MCGFIGKISDKVDNFEIYKDSNDVISCRGPDETKHIYDKIDKIFPDSKNNKNILAFFNRLSIIDLSDQASQPMVSDKYKSLILFNGEIYNHKELRIDMESDGIKFKSSHSDTETLLNGFSIYGLDFLYKIEGQFAITFLDSIKNKVYLIRDRVGQKPLFYKFNSYNLCFSSGLRPLALSENQININENSLVDYLDYGVVPSPNTIFKEIYKVEPAEIVQFDISNEIKLERKYKYWEIEKYIDNKSFEEDIFFDKFSSAVTKRLESDVPIAALSSGGIDSSSIIKNLSGSQKNLSTFSVGYSDPKYDESEWFLKVSEKYGTNQTSSIIEIKNLEKKLNESIESFDEPYSDPSTLPSYLISKEISKNYKVAISGDGGDELLFGYKRSKYMSRYKPKKYISNSIDKIYPKFLGTGNNFKKYNNEKINAYASFFSDKNFLDILNLNSNLTFEKSFFSKHEDNFKSTMITEYKFFLSEMMMLKVDTTSMANSLEVRSPFVDHKLIEYILMSKIDEHSSIYNKSILKKYLSSDFDKNFLTRDKMGFVFNLEKWIYENSNNVKDVIKGINLNINLSRTQNLFRFKSRINAQRLWKLYFLAIYLSWFDNR